MRCILSDAYANAFNREANGKGHTKDKTEMSPFVWERKYEIDSLCYPIQLAYLYWKNTLRTSHFDDLFLKMLKKVVEVAVDDNLAKKVGCENLDQLKESIHKQIEKDFRA